MKLFKCIFALVVISLFLNVTTQADTLLGSADFYLDKTKVVSQQIELLNNRVNQAYSELAHLQHHQDHPLVALSPDHVNKQLLNGAQLDITMAKSNLASMDIELAEAQQTVSQVEKDIQEIENQLNVLNIFGLKITRSGVPNPIKLEADLNYQRQLLYLEKTRLSRLVTLHTLADNILQLYSLKYSHIQMLLKSQTLLQLKEQRAKSEMRFQQRQSSGLRRLNNLYAQLDQLERSKSENKSAYLKLENEIFYANESVNFTYLQMLIARYQDQIQQLKVSVSRSSSIAVLNKVNEQIQALAKQFAQLDDLFTTRIAILEKRKDFLIQENTNNADYVMQLTTLQDQYKTAVATVTSLNQALAAFSASLTQALQQELASRQGLPAFSAKAWRDLGNEILLVPALTFQVTKSLAHAFIKAIYFANSVWWLLFCLLEFLWIATFYFLNGFFARIVADMPDHEFGHINLKWLSIKLLQRNLVNIAIVGNLFWLFTLSEISSQNFNFLIDLGLVGLLFKGILTIARLCLVETVHDRAGHDVRLYHRLKWVFLVGGVVTALTVFVNQLPLIYEVKDLCARLFLLFLVIVSIFLLKSWEVLPELIVLHIDEGRTYFRGIVRLLGLLIPIVLLINSAIGLFGFLNLVLTISWYEGIFILVLIAYLVIKGLLNDGMEFMSHLLIRHVTNGWLWTEAFLKPIDKVLRVALFLAAWLVLFLFYGWNEQSPVVERFNKILHYRLFDVLNTTFTLLSVIETAVIIALLYWAARWTREFVYRFLLSRTKDLGIRNSIAIFSQYVTVLIGIFICLRVLGIDFRALAVVAGMFSLGIGLGLRDLANNFACGFLLLIERPLRVGDIVSFNNYEGEVIHIGGRAVTIRTWDHMEVLVPNAEIFTKTFTNWTAKDNIVRTVIAVKINRHDDPHQVQTLIYQVLTNHKDVLNDPAPEVFLKELAEGLIEFEVRYFVNLRQIKSRVGLRSDILLNIWETFKQHDIKEPYPHHEIFVSGMKSPSLVT